MVLWTAAVCDSNPAVFDRAKHLHHIRICGLEDKVYVYVWACMCTWRVCACLLSSDKLSSHFFVFRSVQGLCTNVLLCWVFLNLETSFRNQNIFNYISIWVHSEPILLNLLSLKVETWSMRNRHFINSSKFWRLCKTGLKIETFQLNIPKSNCRPSQRTSRHDKGGTWTKSPEHNFHNKQPH